MTADNMTADARRRILELWLLVFLAAAALLTLVSWASQLRVPPPPGPRRLDVAAGVDGLLAVAALESGWMNRHLGRWALVPAALIVVLAIVAAGYIHATYLWQADSVYHAYHG